MKPKNQSATLSVPKEMTLAANFSCVLFFAALTGLLAGVRIPLPFTPVPLTGQVIAVLLTGLYLNSPWAGLSQLCYLLLGLSGIPWFAGWQNLNILTFIYNPTAGYLLGFIPAAWLVGKVAHHRNENGVRCFFSLLAAILIIYFCGSLYLMALLKTNLQKTFFLAVYPFILFDLLKALLVGSFALWQKK